MLRLAASAPRLRVPLMSNVRGHVRQLLKAAFLCALLLPPLFVGLAAWAWWSALSAPWAFVVAGCLLLYGFAAYLMTRQFRGIGITGQPSSSGRDVLASLRREAALSLAVFSGFATLSLSVLRFLLSR